MSSPGTGYPGEGAVQQASVTLFHLLLTMLGDSFALDAITGFLKISCLSKFTGSGQTLLLGMDKGKS